MHAAAGRKSFSTLWLDALFLLKKKKRKQNESAPKISDFDIAACGAAHVLCHQNA
jgi:hypothetical protein